MQCKCSPRHMYIVSSDDLVVSPAHTHTAQLHGASQLQISSWGQDPVAPSAPLEWEERVRNGKGEGLPAYSACSMQGPYIPQEGDLCIHAPTWSNLIFTKHKFLYTGSNISLALPVIRDLAVKAKALSRSD